MDKPKAKDCGASRELVKMKIPKLMKKPRAHVWTRRFEEHTGEYMYVGKGEGANDKVKDNI